MTAATAVGVMVAAVANRRTVLKSDENATNLLCCARLQRKFFTAYLLLMSSIWQLILKHEFWILMAVWAGLMVAHEITGNALLPGFGTMVFILAVARLAMHPMWEKGEQSEDESTQVLFVNTCHGRHLHPVGFGGLFHSGFGFSQRALGSLYLCASDGDVDFHCVAGPREQKKRKHRQRPRSVDESFL